MQILEYYQKKNVIFAHEVGPQQIAYNYETTKEILNIMDSESFGICIDPSNFIIVGIDPCVIIDELTRKIVHFHGKDAELTHHRSTSG